MRKIHKHTIDTKYVFINGSPMEASINDFMVKENIKEEDVISISEYNEWVTLWYWK